MEDLQHAPYFLWQPAACLRVTGEDALTFLQGQATNNLSKLIPNEAIYVLWLNQKGKVVADSFVHRMGEDAFLLVSYGSTAAVIQERLEAYIIADDVMIEDETDRWKGISFVSETPCEQLQAVLPEGVLFRGRRGGVTQWEWLVPVVSHPELSAKLDPMLELDEVEMERRRIAAAIPAVPQDIGPGELPNEGGLDRDAISYTKGCYLGQEVMARLKAMGKVRRQLLRVSAAASVPALPAALFAGERPVGELRSAVMTDEGFDGLALITLMHVPADRKLALTANGPALVTLQIPA